MEEKSKLQLIGEIAQANNKNLELIEEINERENEIERLNNIIKRYNDYLKKELGKVYSDTFIKWKIRELKGSDKVE